MKSIMWYNKGPTNLEPFDKKFSVRYLIYVSGSKRIIKKQFEDILMHLHVWL